MEENKGQNRRTKPARLPRIKKPQYFKAGLLTFEDLGHPLIRDGKYYRCTLNCHGKCDVHTKQIPTETLERAFARKIKSFAIEPEKAETILTKILRENIGEVIMGVDEEINQKEELFDLALTTMKQDEEATGNIEAEDIKDAVEALTKIHKANYPTMLLGFIPGTLRALAHPEYEAELGRAFAFMSKNISLSNKGKIISIELERWAWYILNLIDRYIPNYLTNIRMQGVELENEPDRELAKLSIARAALLFNMNKAQEAMSTNMRLMSQSVKMLQDGIQSVIGTTDPKETNKVALLFLEEMKNNPEFAIVMQMANSLGLEME